MEQAAETVALSRSDSEFLAAHVSRSSYHAAGNKPHVLLCGLRSDLTDSDHVSPDIRAAVEAAEDFQTNIVEGTACAGGSITACSVSATAVQRTTRPLLLCAVRLVPEKNPELFVQLAGRLHASGALMRLGVTPLLVAPATDDYAKVEHA